jgi:hypothetical protein
MISVPWTAAADGDITLTGKVRDAKGRPVAGAEVFIYNTPQVKRTADFISPQTDKNGVYAIVLPAGTYWAVARSRKGGERFGPLMPGDKHSGDPVEIDCKSQQLNMDFTVLDLKEAAGLMGKKTMRQDCFRIQGRILDRDGKPVPSAYAMANRDRPMSEIPDYLSAWTDEEGRYTLYLPAGAYRLGYATAFPPGSRRDGTTRITVKGDRNGVDIVAGNSD